MKNHVHLVLYLLLSAILAFFVYDLTNSAKKEAINRDYKSCVERQKARTQSAKRFAAQRDFLLAYEAVVSRRAQVDVKINRDLARSDIELIRAADKFRRATVDYPKLHCTR